MGFGVADEERTALEETYEDTAVSSRMETRQTGAIDRPSSLRLERRSPSRPPQLSVCVECGSPAKEPITAAQFKGAGEMCIRDSLRKVYRDVDYAISKKEGSIHLHGVFSKNTVVLGSNSSPGTIAPVSYTHLSFAGHGGSTISAWRRTRRQLMNRLTKYSEECRCACGGTI